MIPTWVTFTTAGVLMFLTPFLAFASWRHSLARVFQPHRWPIPFRRDSEIREVLFSILTQKGTPLVAFVVVLPVIIYVASQFAPVAPSHSHPTLPQEEQTRIRAECEMQRLEHRIRDAARRTYMGACRKRHGFVREWRK